MESSSGGGVTGGQSRKVEMAECVLTVPWPAFIGLPVGGVGGQPRPDPRNWLGERDTAKEERKRDERCHWTPPSGQISSKNRNQPLGWLTHVSHFTYLQAV